MATRLAVAMPASTVARRTRCGGPSVALLTSTTSALRARTVGDGGGDRGQLLQAHDDLVRDASRAEQRDVAEIVEVDALRAGDRALRCGRHEGVGAREDRDEPRVLRRRRGGEALEECRAGD